MKIAVIGCGNMAQALVIPMAKNNSEIEIFCYTPSNTRAHTLASAANGTVVTKLSELPKCDLYLLGFKPQNLADFAINFKSDFPSGATILSILAGVTTNKLTDLLGLESIIRVMPNTPSLVKEGANAIFFTSSVDQKTVSKVLQYLKSVGQVFQFNTEDKIDIITPFSGSGPAYIFEIARILIDKLSSMGIDEVVATQIINQTLLGSSKLLGESEKSAKALRDSVTSKNGVTYEALEVFKEAGLETIVGTAIDKAFKRAKEL